MGLSSLKIIFNELLYTQDPVSMENSNRLLTPYNIIEKMSTLNAFHLNARAHEGSFQWFHFNRCEKCLLDGSRTKLAGNRSSGG